MRVKPIVLGGVVLAVLGWVLLMISFWLPGIAGEALQATALALGLPGLVTAVCGYAFWREIEDHQENITASTVKPQPLRCTECQTKILNASGDVWHRGKEIV
jgi:hypothetical protein